LDGRWIGERQETVARQIALGKKTGKGGKETFELWAITRIRRIGKGAKKVYNKVQRGDVVGVLRGGYKDVFKMGLYVLRRPHWRYP